MKNTRLVALAGFLAVSGSTPLPGQSVKPYGCGVNPAGSLKVSAGTKPTIGTTIKFEINNPPKTQGCSTFTALLLHAVPDSAFPCGTKVPGWGMSKVGAPGEFLLAPGFPMANGPVWGCTSGPAVVSLIIPTNVAFIGAKAFVQGLMFQDKNPIGFALTNGLELTIGPSPKTLAFGASILSSIAPVKELEIHEISALAGDQLVIPYVDVTGGGFSLDLSLYDSSWKLLKVIRKTTSGEFRAAIPSTGKYFLVVGTSSGRTGSYHLTLQRTRKPGGVSARKFGDSVRQSITPAITDIDVYEFSALSGDKLHIPYVDVTGGGFALRLDLYDATGKLLANSTARTSGVFAPTISSSGQYFLWVYNPLRNRTGSYHLTLQRTRKPGAVSASKFGDSVRQSISPAITDIDVYEFSALSGDKLYIPYVDVTGGGFALRLDLYDATGNLLASSTGTTKGVFKPTIPSAGQYFLWVYNPLRNRTGSYHFTLQRTARSQPVTMIIPGGNAINGSISPAITEIDIYVFPALPAQRRLAHFTDLTGGGFALEATLRDASGAVLISSRTSPLPINVTNIGTYYLWIRNPLLNRTGSYRVQIK